MTIAHVQSKNGANAGGAGSTCSAQFDSASAVGNSIVAVCRMQDSTVSAPTITSVTCTSESNLTEGLAPVTNLLGSKYCGIAIYYLGNITTADQKTVTVTWGAAYGGKNVSIYEVSGADTSSFFDTANSASGTGNDPAVNLTPTNANALIVTALVNNKGAATKPTGYTDTFLSDVAIAWYCDEAYDEDVGTAALKTITWTRGSNPAYLVAAAAFNVAGGAPAATPKFLSLLGVG